MKLRIERKTADLEVPQEFDITFWPRTYAKVEGWGWTLVNAKD